MSLWSKSLRARRRLFVAGALGALLPACSSSPSPSPSESPAEVARVHATKCASCHVPPERGVRTRANVEGDRNSGQNGDTLHVTVRVEAPSTLLGKAHPFAIVSSRGEITQAWPGLVTE